jgi:glycosyltransferase involved in cell wall biosynthesis
MTITIDCRMLGASGVGVYLCECLPYLLSSPHDFVLLGDAARLAQIVDGKTGLEPGTQQNAKILSCDIKPFSIHELFLFPRLLLKTINQTDLFYSPFFNIPGGIKVPGYTTIHDIVFPDMPELTSKIGLAVRMFFFRRAFRRSKKIFTVSEFSKSRIEYHLDSKTPVVVTYNAPQVSLLKQNTAHIKKTETIIFIGNIKKHKGLAYLLDAFFQAKKEGLKHKLIIVGNKDNFRSADTKIATQLEKIDPAIVEFTGFVPDEKLKTLVAEAALLVQPSLYEGFGYPPLEALVSGTPALISDIPVFKEIYAGFPVTFFRAGDSGDLKDKLMQMLYNKEPEQIVLPAQLREKYTFEKTTGIILEALTRR